MVGSEKTTWYFRPLDYWGNRPESTASKWFSGLTFVFGGLGLGTMAIVVGLKVIEVKIGALRGTIAFGVPGTVCFFGPLLVKRGKIVAPTEIKPPPSHIHRTLEEYFANAPTFCESLTDEELFSGLSGKKCPSLTAKKEQYMKENLQGNAFFSTDDADKLPAEWRKCFHKEFARRYPGQQPPGSNKQQNAENQKNANEAQNASTLKNSNPSVSGIHLSSSPPQPAASVKYVAIDAKNKPFIEKWKNDFKEAVSTWSDKELQTYLDEETCPTDTIQRHIISLYTTLQEEISAPVYDNLTEFFKAQEEEIINQVLEERRSLEFDT